MKTIAIAAALLIGGAIAGWQARGVVAENKELRAIKENADALRLATEQAINAADDYARKRDAMEPQVRIVRVQSEPIIRELVRCPLPADAARVLDAAASAADGADARSRANGAGAAPAAGTQHRSDGG